MPYPSPIFPKDIPYNPQKRFDLIRHFIESWYEIQLPNQDVTKEIQYIEKKTGLTLPIAFRQYILLSYQLMNLEYVYENGMKGDGYGLCFRDDYEVKKLEEHKALSLMIQGEQDFYWAVKYDDLDKDDPPIQGYLLDYDDPTNKKFDHYCQIAPTLTSFVLDHLFTYLSRHSSFGRQVTRNNAVLSILQKSFQHYTRFDDIDIFEDENRLACLTRNHFEEETNEYFLKVHLFQKQDLKTLPKALISLTQNGGWFSGDFIED